MSKLTSDKRQIKNYQTIFILIIKKQVLFKIPSFWLILYNLKFSQWSLILIKSTKRTGPKIDPCDTPDMIGFKDDLIINAIYKYKFSSFCSMFTDIDNSLKIWLYSLPLISQIYLGLRRIRSWLTESKYITSVLTTHGLNIIDWHDNIINKANHISCAIFKVDKTMLTAILYMWSFKRSSSLIIAQIFYN